MRSRRRRRTPSPTPRSSSVSTASPHAATFGASGEGLYFTGAPRFASLDCSTCHTDGPQTVGLHLNADDPSLFDRGYKPGRTYELQVELTNETEGLKYKTPTCTDPPAPGDTYSYVQCNNNGFALEIDDESGTPLAGPNVYCAAAAARPACARPPTSPATRRSSRPTATPSSTPRSTRPIPTCRSW